MFHMLKRAEFAKNPAMTQPANTAPAPIFDLLDLNETLFTLMSKNDLFPTFEAEAQDIGDYGRLMIGNVAENASIRNRSRALHRADYPPLNPTPEKLSLLAGTLHGIFRDMGKYLGDLLDEEKLPEPVNSAIKTYDAYVAKHRQKIAVDADEKTAFVEAIATIRKEFSTLARIPFKDGTMRPNLITVNVEGKKTTQSVGVFLFGIARARHAQIDQTKLPDYAVEFLQESAGNTVHIIPTAVRIGQNEHYPDVQASLHQRLRHHESEIIHAVNIGAPFLQTLCLYFQLRNQDNIAAPGLRLLDTLGYALFPAQLETMDKVTVVLDGLLSAMEKWHPRKDMMAEQQCVEDVSTRYGFINGRMNPRTASRLRTFLNEAYKDGVKKNSRLVTDAVELVRNSPVIAPYLDATPAPFASGGRASGLAPAPVHASHRR